MNLEKTSQKIGLKEIDIINVLFLIKEKSPTLSELVKITNLSHGLVKRIVLQLRPYIPYTKSSLSRLTLNNKGSNLIKSSQREGAKTDYEELFKFITLSKNLLPKPKREYDQFYAESETVLNRVKKFVCEKDIQDRNIVFLGDDDLVSLAAAYTNLAKEVLVLEIDKDIIEIINTVSKKKGLHVKTYLWDLKKAIPNEYLHKYDTVFTDPPYTEDGFDLFLRRSLEITKDSMLSSHYICYGTSSLSKERSLKIQKIIDFYNLFLREKLSRFNKYINGAETVGNASDLYILEKTPQTKLGKSKPITKLYTWE